MAEDKHNSVDIQSEEQKIKKGDFSMSTLTTNYGLVKPDVNDTYDIAVQNSNMDAIDTALHDLDDSKADQTTVDELKKSVSDGKTLVADAITGKGVNTVADASFQTMATNIGSIEVGIDTSGTTATVGDILKGKTAGVGGAIITGAMEKKTGTTWWCGYETVSLQPHPSASDQGVVTIPNTYNQPGYYDDTSAVSGNIANLNAGNIRAGITVGQSGGDSTNCIIGNFTADATALANQILYGQTAYVNGSKVTGSMPNYNGTNQPTGGVWTDGSSLVGFANANSGYYPGGNASGITASYSAVASAIGLTSEKLVVGNTICGVVGTGKRYASGNATITKGTYGSRIYNADFSTSSTGTYGSTESTGRVYIISTGLSWIPSVIKITLDESSRKLVWTIHKNTYVSCGIYLDEAYEATYLCCVKTSDLKVLPLNDGSTFYLPYWGTSVIGITWEAWE